MSFPGSQKATCRNRKANESTEPLAGRLGAVVWCTARAVRISRSAAKSHCACEWGGWGRISVDGPGHYNLDRSEDPWGKAAEAACTVVHQRNCVPGLSEYDHRQFSGFVVPTRRRVHPRKLDGRPRRHPVLVWINVANVVPIWTADVPSS